LPADLDLGQVNSLIPRAKISIASVSADVEKLIAEFKSGGVSALEDHAMRFDGVVPESFKIPVSELEKALADLDPELRSAIETAISRVQKVSEATLPNGVSVQLASGSTVEQVYVPVDSVGLYVPGGKAVYPSSVVMNAVPALVAKVPRIVVCSPAQKDNGGLPNSTIMATCALLGIT
jgi:histidinol dehydrogenase